MLACCLASGDAWGQAPPTYQFEATVTEVIGDSDAWLEVIEPEDRLQVTMTPQRVEFLQDRYYYRRDLQIELPGGRLEAPWHRVGYVDLLGILHDGNYVYGPNIHCFLDGAKSSSCSMGFVDNSIAHSWSTDIRFLGETDIIRPIGGTGSEEWWNSMNSIRELRLDFWEGNGGVSDPLLTVKADIGPMVFVIPEPSSLLVALPAIAALARRRRRMARS